MPAAAGGLGHGVPDPPVEVLHHFVENGLLAVEVQVEGTQSDAGRFRDLDDGGFVVAHRSEHRFGRFEQLGPGPRAPGGAWLGAHGRPPSAWAVLVPVRPCSASSCRSLARSTLFSAVRGSAADHRDPGGDLEGGQLGRAVLQQFLLVGGHPGADHHEGRSAFAPAFVRHTDDGGLRHRGMRQQHLLHLGRRNVFAAGDVDVLEPVHHPDVPVGVAFHQVPGAQPAAGEDGSRGAPGRGSTPRRRPGPPTSSSPVAAPS